MTNKEKAKETADFLIFKLSHIDYDTLKRELLEIAEWKEQQMIQKACEWLEKNAIEHLGFNPISETFSLSWDFIDLFKKAMMEE